MTTYVVLLGSSHYQHDHLQRQSGVFARSHRALRDCLVLDHGLELGATLFDHFDDSAAQTWGQVRESLASRLPQCDDSDALVIVHIGHGQRTPGQELRLAMPGSDRDLEDGALTARSLVAFQADRARFATNVIIVDACFGAALADDAVRCPDRPAYGLHVLSAAEADSTAEADPDLLHTAFTSALVDVLRFGVASQRPDLFDVIEGDAPLAPLSIIDVHRALVDRAASIHGGRVADPVLRPVAPEDPGLVGRGHEPVFDNLASRLRSAAVLSSRDAGSAQARRLSHAVTILPNTDPGRRLAAAARRDAMVRPRQHRIVEAVSDVQSLKAALADVAGCDLVFADVTDFEPVAMFLLGFRAATTRGVTVCSCLSGEFERLLHQEPFHLREVPITIHGERDARHTTDELVARASAGFSELRDFDHYSDLPAFDALRQTPRPGAARLDIDWSHEALALCPFGTDYVQNNWSAIERNVTAAVETLRPGSSDRFRVRRTLDLPSPRVVSSALFDYIRRAQLCIVDLSSWRAGVLFELGVRYAVGRVAPICVIDARQLDDLRRVTTIDPNAWNERWSGHHFDHATAERYAAQALGLVDILRPLAYDPDTDDVREALVDRVRAVSDPFEPEPASAPSLRIDAELRSLAWRRADPTQDRHADLASLLDDAVLRDGGRDENEGRRYLVYPASSPIWRDIDRVTADRQIMALLYLTARLAGETRAERVTALRRRITVLRTSLEEHARRQGAAPWVRAILDGHPPQAEPAFEPAAGTDRQGPSDGGWRERAADVRARSRASRVADLEGAAALAEAGAEEVEAGLLADPTADRARVAADLWGEAAGCHRRREDWDAAGRCYERGRNLERDHRLVNSYHLTNAIVARLMRRPDDLHRVRDEIATAAATVRSQVQGPRRGDFWAWADAVLLYALCDDTGFQVALEEYLDRGDDASFRATADVMTQIGGVIGDGVVRDRIDRAVRAMRVAAARL